MLFSFLLSLLNFNFMSFCYVLVLSSGFCVILFHLYIKRMFLCVDEILFNADVEDIAFLVVGDPFGCVIF